jgi:hypothetical protein
MSMENVSRERNFSSTKECVEIMTKDNKIVWVDLGSDGDG